jgi:hypothetical protein
MVRGFGFPQRIGKHNPGMPRELISSTNILR